mgnify:CR=1 FL=1
MRDNSNLVWIDLEMSGLDPVNDVILEIATIVTGPDLAVLAEGPNLVIHQPDEILDNMDEWNTRHHGESGLTQRVRESDVSTEIAERKTVQFLRNYVEPEMAPLCGNSIAQDRRFLYKYMPRLSSFLHYRSVDVSSIKELVMRWYDDLEPPRKDTNHRALDDIRESIEELKFYREHVFVT